MIIQFLKDRAHLLALIFVAGWGGALKIENSGLHAKLLQCDQAKASILVAMDEATALAEAAREDEERRFAANAERSDASHAQDDIRAAHASRAFADRNRITVGGMRAESDRGATGQANPASESGSAGLSPQMSAASLVAVSDPDLQACTAAVTYAVAAHNWAATLPVSSGEEPPEPPHRE